MADPAAIGRLIAAMVKAVSIGVSVKLRSGPSAGVETAVEAAELLSKKRIEATVVDARFIKPLDEELLSDICGGIKKVVTIEEGVLEGGFGSSVLEFIERTSMKGVTVRRVGLPPKFIEHGKREELFSKYNLTPTGICDVIINEVIR